MKVSAILSKLHSLTSEKKSQFFQTTLMILTPMKGFACDWNIGYASKRQSSSQDQAYDQQLMMMKSMTKAAVQLFFMFNLKNYLIQKALAENQYFSSYSRRTDAAQTLYFGKILCKHWIQRTWSITAELCTQTHKRDGRLESQKVSSQSFRQGVGFSSNFHHFLTLAQLPFSSVAIEDQMFVSSHIRLIGEL